MYILRFVSKSSLWKAKKTNLNLSFILKSKKFIRWRWSLFSIKVQTKYWLITLHKKFDIKIKKYYLILLWFRTPKNQIARKLKSKTHKFQWMTFWKIILTPIRLRYKSIVILCCMYEFIEKIYDTLNFVPNFETRKRTKWKQ
jgi:hypothetical protein